MVILNLAQTDEFYAFVRKASFLDLKAYISQNEIDVKNCRDKNDITLAHVISEIGDLAIMNYLFESGSDPIAEDRWGRIPMHVACSKGHIELVKYFMDTFNCDVLKQSKEGFSCMHYSVPHSKMVQYLIQRQPDSVRSVARDGCTPLMLACKKSHVESVRVLVEEGHADIFAQDVNGVSCFSFACWSGDADIVRYLLSLKRLQPSHLNSSSVYGYTSLHYACMGGNYDVVSMLLREGASTSIRDSNNMTPADMTTDSNIIVLLETYIPEQQQLTSSPLSNRSTVLRQVDINLPPTAPAINFEQQSSPVNENKAPITNSQLPCRLIYSNSSPLGFALKKRGSSKKEYRGPLVYSNSSPLGFALRANTDVTSNLKTNTNISSLASSTSENNPVMSKSATSLPNGADISMHGFLSRTVPSSSCTDMEIPHDSAEMNVNQSYNGYNNSNDVTPVLSQASESITKASFFSQSPDHQDPCVCLDFQEEQSIGNNLYSVSQQTSRSAHQWNSSQCIGEPSQSFSASEVTLGYVAEVDSSGAMNGIVPRVPSSDPAPAMDTEESAISTTTATEVSALPTSTATEVSALPTSTATEVSALPTTTATEVSPLHTTTATEVSALPTTTATEVSALHTSAVRNVSAVLAAVVTEEGALPTEHNDISGMSESNILSHDNSAQSLVMTEMISIDSLSYSSLKVVSNFPSQDEATRATASMISLDPSPDESSLLTLNSSCISKADRLISPPVAVPTPCQTPELNIQSACESFDFSTASQLTPVPERVHDSSNKFYVLEDMNTSASKSAIYVSEGQGSAEVNSAIQDLDAVLDSSVSISDRTESNLDSRHINFQDTLVPPPKHNFVQPFANGRANPMFRWTVLEGIISCKNDKPDLSSKCPDSKLEHDN